MKNENSRPGAINRRSFIQLVAVASTAAACWQLGVFSSPSLQVARKSKPMMGTVINLTLYGPDREECEETLTRVFDVMQGLEKKLSRHMTHSDLALLNKTGRLDNPDHDLLQVLQTAQTLNSHSQGGFDVTILPLLKLFEEAKVELKPLVIDDYSVARDLIGQSNVTITPNRISLAKEDMGISLDGIGKGYIVDQGVATLKELGFNNVYVEAGGDLMVSGQKEGKTPWRIGLRNPRPKMDSKLVAISASDKAVATSGDYFQTFSPDFKKHHIIDPRSGFSPPELASVTVTAPSVTMADGLATTVMVLGKRQGIELIESMRGCEVFMVTKDLQQYHSTGFFS